MDHRDWDPDELLDFDYGHPVNRTEEKKNSKNIDSDSQKRYYDDLKQYEELRKNSKQQAATPAAASGAYKSSSSKLSAEEAEALKQAQRDAYERYRGNYKKNARKKVKSTKSSRKAAAKLAGGGSAVRKVNRNGRNAGKAGLFPRLLSLLYVAALAVFTVCITIMDVLPGRILFLLYAVLALLSFIIIIMLRKRNVRKWVRRFASVIAILLIAFFGVGSSYAMGTLSFLNFTSVDNSKRVSSVVKEPFNVCITGIDVKGKIDTEGRSDVNMIVTVNPSTAQILMTSIPRDYQIYMPDFDNAMDKLTHTGFYGVDTTIGAEEQLLDTQMNYFVKVNFSTVEKFIDAIGGIDVYSEYSFTPVKLKSWTVQEGMNHMNGKQALAFARERKAFLTGDNQRIKNQQAVMEAIIEKATSSPSMMLSYNKVLSELKDYFKMSFSSYELRSLVKLQLAKNPEWKIYKNALVGDNGSLPTYSTGSAYAYVMLQDEYSIENAKTLMNAVLNGDKLKKDKEGNVTVAGEKTEESDG